MGTLAPRRAAVSRRTKRRPLRALVVSPRARRKPGSLRASLDRDHVPFPEFLDRVVGYFDDAGVGFVQVAQAYYNAPRSFVARAAAEQTFAFYGPILQGMHGTGTAVAIGANCTFRRTALESI